MKFFQALRVALVALASLSLTHCTTGDFGRPKRTLVGDDTHAWLGPAATGRVPKHGAHQLTDQERHLRDLAYPLIEPPYERNKWYAALAENGLLERPFPFPERGAYASHLMNKPYRSQTARYSQLIDDIRNDVTRVDGFFSVAGFVGDMDRRRAAALGQVTTLDAVELDRTRSRIAENRGIVKWTKASMQERAESYRIALERLVLAAPSPTAVEAERSLGLLQERLTRYGA